jgi:hypothetical protein
MGLIKNRDVIIQIYDTLSEDFSNSIVDQIKLFVKSINYDIKPVGATFLGLKESDTLQWYSSIYEFQISGDSYVNPFIIPTLTTADNNITKLYQLYTDKFKEGESFQLGRYKIRLKINNSPIKDDIFDGIITSFSFDESDEKIGLVNYKLTISGKATNNIVKENAIDGFIKDLFLE